MEYPGWINENPQFKSYFYPPNSPQEMKNQLSRETIQKILERPDGEEILKSMGIRNPYAPRTKTTHPPDVIPDAMVESPDSPENVPW